MTILKHPEQYKTGIRLLMLKGRYKDGVKVQRSVLRISYTASEFDRKVQELVDLMEPGERIYGSAAPRDMHKAVRKFKERQLANEYQLHPDDFYRALEARWYSCLADPTSVAHKFWIFDCDTEEDYAYTMNELSTFNEWVARNADKAVDKGPAVEFYDYKTKSGWHIVCNPFNLGMICERAQKLAQKDALILWGWCNLPEHRPLFRGQRPDYNPKVSDA